MTPAYYTDWGDPREFTIGDLGMLVNVLVKS